METNTEIKHEWQFGEYFARTWFGSEYGTSTEWFKGEALIHETLVPLFIQTQHEEKVAEVEDSL